MELFPFLIGDFNCVTNQQDVSSRVYGNSGDISINGPSRSHFHQKKSKELKDIVVNFGYLDVYLYLNNPVDYTWLRKGSRPSRLDRMYIPKDLAIFLSDARHIIHLSDHKAVLVGIKLSSASLPPKQKKNSDFSKLNSRVLDDKNFQQNFDKVLMSFASVSSWFDECFKNKMKDFLRNFSSFRQRSRRDTRSYLINSLQFAGKEEDLDLISYIKSQLRKMDMEDSLGIIIRSKFNESLESEKLSLFHVNREVKRGAKSRLSKLSKIVEEERVVVEDQPEIERIAVNFFSSLFQGYHTSDGCLGPKPFEPDFSDLDFFLDKVGSLSDVEA